MRAGEGSALPISKELQEREALTYELLGSQPWQKAPWMRHVRLFMA